MSDQRYVEIPGSKTHELPPLLLHCATHCATDLTSVMLEAEDMLASTDAGEEILERRKLDLALQLTQQYKETAQELFPIGRSNGVVPLGENCVTRDSQFA